MADSAKIEHIRGNVRSRQLLFTAHARQEMGSENFTFEDIESGLMTGEIIEDYPHHQRGACCLINGRTPSGRPIHIVCTTHNTPTIVITVYEPKPPKFETPTKRSKR
ncbi:MAG: DUF4258 domain-containing protein [Chloroherpetonaceae bacterium]|nr:DUF4258 domain-containing protein [Chloroherpetonaceae bacterium]